MTRLSPFAVLLTFILASATPFVAAECVPVTENPEYDSERDTPGAWTAAHDALGNPSELGARDRHFYVDNDFCQLELCSGSIWVYEESNGRAGLQRNDDFAGDRTCGLFPADTIVV